MPRFLPALAMARERGRGTPDRKRGTSPVLITMRYQMSGGRHDGRPWPPPGPESPFEVPDWEGLDLIRGGMADPYGDAAREAADAVAERPSAGHPSKLDLREAEAPAESLAEAPAETADAPADQVEPAAELNNLAAAVADGEAGDGAEAAERDGAMEPAPDPAPPGQAAAETRTPGPASPKQMWIDYAVQVHGADVHAATAMTKADLMSRYGGRL